MNKNGALISTINGDNSITINTINAGDFGTYRCLISNQTIPDLTLETTDIFLV